MNLWWPTLFFDFQVVGWLLDAWVPGCLNAWMLIYLGAWIQLVRRAPCPGYHTSGDFYVSNFCVVSVPQTLTAARSLTVRVWGKVPTFLSAREYLFLATVCKFKLETTYRPHHLPTHWIVQINRRKLGILYLMKFSNFNIEWKVRKLRFS